MVADHLVDQVELINMNYARLSDTQHFSVRIWRTPRHCYKFICAMNNPVPLK